MARALGAVLSKLVIEVTHLPTLRATAWHWEQRQLLLTARVPVAANTPQHKTHVGTMVVVRAECACVLMAG